MLVCLCIVIINLSFKHKAKQAFGQDNFFLCQNGIARQVCVQHVLVCKVDGLKNPLLLGQIMPPEIFWYCISLGVPCQTRTLVGTKPLSDAKD